MATFDAITKWLEQAPDEVLRLKQAEYSDERGVLSPRDSEMRLRLRNRITIELTRRASNDSPN